MFFKNTRILLVEDNPGDARLVEMALREAPGGTFDIVHVKRLGSALAQLDAGGFAAVLLDLSLPDSHGLETVDLVKTAHPNVPIVVLSGSLDEALAYEAVKSGAQDYLVKGQGDGHLMARAIRYAMERKHTEQELRRSHVELEQRVADRTAALAETNRRLREEIAERLRAGRELHVEHAFNTALLDTVGALILVCDRDGRVVRCNRACELATGCAFETLEGRRFRELFDDAQSAERAGALFEAILGGGYPVEWEAYWPGGDGGRRLIAWTHTALIDDAGAVAHVICCGNDITERKRLEEREKQRLMELAHLLRLNTLGEMATEIAHELNQPLTAIAAYSSACSRLLQSGSQTGDVQEALRGISGQAQRAGEIIRRLRRFARKEKPEQVALDINHLIREVVKLLQVGPRWKGVEVAADLNDELPRTLADPVLVEQVIVNLVRNALEAMEECDGRRPRLQLGSAPAGAGMIAVTVADNGPGLKPELMERMFEPFVTTKPGGIGVGLSLSRSIIEAHGGTLQVLASESGGATFQFTLPVHEGEGRP